MQEKKSKTCCFTGHRIIPPEILPFLIYQLEITLHKLIQKGICYFGAGGALGFDTLAAETVLRLKKQYPQIRLILVLPCYEQTNRWQPHNVERYKEILLKADKIVYVSKHYTRDCMYQRDRYLVDNSSICISYCTRSTGGSAYTVNYAKKQGLKIIHLVPNAAQICD